MSDKKENKVNAGNNSIVIQGNVTGSNIIAGNNNVVSQNISVAFSELYRAVDADSKLSPAVKTDVKAEIQDVEKEISKGDQADESGAMRHLRNVQRMAPDILDVVVATLANPMAGLGMVAKKIGQKMAEEAQAKG